MPTLPLFPLHTVLFPGLPLGLIVFEPRYLALLQDLHGATEDAFGVVAIRRGEEVDTGRPIELAEVGCAVQIRHLDPAGPGPRYRLQGRGGRRFRIHQVHTNRPYSVADIEWLDPAGDASSQAHWERLGQAVEDLELYLADRQALLEEASISGREAILQGLRRREQLLTMRLAEGPPPGRDGVSPN